MYCKVLQIQKKDESNPKRVSHVLIEVDAVGNTQLVSIDPSMIAKSDIINTCNSAADSMRGANYNDSDMEDVVGTDIHPRP